jgi:HlyD family secretion protein
MTVLALKRQRTPEGDAEEALSPMDRPLRRRLIAPGRLLAGLGILAVIGIGFYGYVRYGLTRTLQIDAARVTISTVQRATYSDYIPVTGNIAPRNTVYLDAIEGGQVTEVLVEEGNVVNAGQKLVKLKNTQLQLDVIGREAQFTEQINNLANAQLAARQSALQHKRDLIDAQYQIDQLSAQLARKRPLLASGAVPRANVQDLELQLAYYRRVKEAVAEAETADRGSRDRQIDQLQQAIQHMTDNLALAREDLESLTISAPIGGQLTSLKATVGEAMGRNQRIGQIDQTDSFKIAAQVDEFYLGRVAAGQKATAEINGKTYNLDVTKVYPGVKDRQFEADLSFEGAPPKDLRRGQSVQLRLGFGEGANSLIIANGDFYDDTAGRWVFVLSVDGRRATRRAVTLGRRNPDSIEVLSGLKEGERVITSTYESYRNIDRIELQKGKAAAPGGEKR